MATRCTTWARTARYGGVDHGAGDRGGTGHAGGAVSHADLCGGVDNGQSRNYDVTRDGRFLINTVLDDAAATPITLIQHWQPK